MFVRGWSPQGSVQNSLVGTPSNTNNADKKTEPPPTDEEMQAKMQFMINLQMAAQEQTCGGEVISDEAPPPPRGPVVPDYVQGAHITPAAAAEAAAAAAATGTTLLSPALPAGMSLSNILDADGDDDTPAANNEKPPAVPPAPKGRSIMGSVPYQEYNPASSGYASRDQQQQAAAAEGVGQGHLYFPGEYAPSEGEQHPMLDGTMPPHYGVGQHSHMMMMGGVDHAVIDARIDDPDYVEQPKRHQCGCWMACVSCWRDAEALHRSFCYASIDGLLTGAGIVSTFLGMGLLTARSSTAMHVLVVAFSLAACTSDAICMALGHVWSTYVLTNAGANERRTERLSFERSRADAKGKLVDMLLSRGMLKIDAMSIADTLEGYPDIFISALVGDSGYTLGEESLTSSASGSGQFGLGYQQGTSPEETTFSPLLRAARRSYGEFNEYELDPEATSVKLALGESRKEGFVMMLSFALFSVLPSLIFLWLSTIMNVSVKHRKSGGTSVTSIAVSLTSLIMLLLGFWKSRFFDSHWVLFGIETVVVLWLCTLSAFFIGLMLSKCLPGLRELIEDNEL